MKGFKNTINDPYVVNIITGLYFLYLSQLSKDKTVLFGIAIVIIVILNVISYFSRRNMKQGKKSNQTKQSQISLKAKARLLRFSLSLIVPALIIDFFYMFIAGTFHLDKNNNVWPISISFFLLFILFFGLSEVLNELEDIKKNINNKYQ